MDAYQDILRNVSTISGLYAPAPASLVGVGGGGHVFLFSVWIASLFFSSEFNDFFTFFYSQISLFLLT